MTRSAAARAVGLSAETSEAEVATSSATHVREKAARTRWRDRSERHVLPSAGAAVAAGLVAMVVEAVLSVMKRPDWSWWLACGGPGVCSASGTAVYSERSTSATDLSAGAAVYFR